MRCGRGSRPADPNHLVGDLIVDGYGRVVGAFVRYSLVCHTAPVEPSTFASVLVP